MRQVAGWSGFCCGMGTNYLLRRVMFWGLLLLLLLLEKVIMLRLLLYYLLGLRVDHLHLRLGMSLVDYCVVGWGYRLLEHC
jgi:hypothetical protein